MSRKCVDSASVAHLQCNHSDHSDDWHTTIRRSSAFYNSLRSLILRFNREDSSEKGTSVALWGLQSAGGKVQARKEPAMALSRFLVVVGAIGLLVIVLDFVRPVRNANPLAG
jgi:hypothetical protein